MSSKIMDGVLKNIKFMIFRGLLSFSCYYYMKNKESQNIIDSKYIKCPQSPQSPQKNKNKF